MADLKRSLEDETLLEGGDQARHLPQRRCFSCRGNGKKHELLRFVVFEGQLCFDLRKKLPGRGYYVCAQAHCLEKAFEMGFKRVTKHAASELAPSCDAFIREVLLPGLRRRYREYLLAARQSNAILFGAESVEKSAKNNQLGCILLATDASSSTDRKYRTNADRKSIPCVGLLDRESVSHLFGKSNKVIMGIIPGEICDKLVQTEDAIKRLEIHVGMTASDKG